MLTFSVPGWNLLKLSSQMDQSLFIQYVTYQTHFCIIASLHHSNLSTNLFSRVHRTKKNESQQNHLNKLWATCWVDLFWHFDKGVRWHTQQHCSSVLCVKLPNWICTKSCLFPFHTRNLNIAMKWSVLSRLTIKLESSKMLFLLSYVHVAR